MPAAPSFGAGTAAASVVTVRLDRLGHPGAPCRRLFGSS